VEKWRPAGSTLLIMSELDSAAVDAWCVFREIGARMGEFRTDAARNQPPPEGTAFGQEEFAALAARKK